nr:probable WRKY transcription factor 65 [Ipomoea batatas]
MTVDSATQPFYQRPRYPRIAGKQRRIRRASAMFHDTQDGLPSIPQNEERVVSVPDQTTLKDQASIGGEQLSAVDSCLEEIWTKANKKAPPFLLGDFAVVVYSDDSGVFRASKPTTSSVDGDPRATSYFERRRVNVTHADMSGYSHAGKRRRERSPFAGSEERRNVRGSSDGIGMMERTSSAPHN